MRTACDIFLLLTHWDYVTPLAESATCHNQIGRMTVHCVTMPREGTAKWWIVFKVYVAKGRDFLQARPRELCLLFRPLPTIIRRWVKSETSKGGEFTPIIPLSALKVFQKFMMQKLLTIKFEAVLNYFQISFHRHLPKAVQNLCREVSKRILRLVVLMTCDQWWMSSTQKLNPTPIISKMVCSFFA